MGQRHQVYLRIKDRKGKKHVVGIHHQWLYGHTALRLLNHIMTYVDQQLQDDWNKKSESYRYGFPLSDLSEAHKVLQSAYSFHAESGYFYGVHPLTVNEFTSNSQTHYTGPETVDPRLGDNNDGITVIDLARKKPKIAFVSLYGIECDESQRDSIKPLTPMSPEQYLRAYYPKYDTQLKDEKGNDLKEFVTYSKGLVKSLSKWKVLTKEELKKIFPAMYKKQKPYAEVSKKLTLSNKSSGINLDTD